MSKLILLLMFTGAEAQAQNQTHILTSGIFTGKDGAIAKVACGGKTDKCMVKIDKISKEYDGKTLMLDLDQGESEWHLVSKKTARFGTLYVDGPTPHAMTVWKTNSGKRVDLKMDAVQTEKFDAPAFFKTSLDEIEK